MNRLVFCYVWPSKYVISTQLYGVIKERPRTIENLPLSAASQLAGGREGGEVVRQKGRGAIWGSTGTFLLIFLRVGRERVG